MNCILQVDDICKKFGTKEILKNINFQIFEKDIVGFIGPNGSGKTTTIKLILGLQSITSGNIYINGYSIKDDFNNAIKRVGAIVENPDSYMYLTGYQNLKLIKNLYPEITMNYIDEIVKLVGLDNRINDKVSKYSLGMRQRLGIAKALMMKPNLLILDEPTNGLDPEGIRDLRNILKKLAKTGVGVLISSHNLSELESFCNKICMIDSGKIIEQSDVKLFKESLNVYVFEVDNTADIKIEGIYDITETSFKLKGDKEKISKIIKKLVNKNVKIYEVKAMAYSLEEAFLNKTGGNKID